jgi:polysaccharide export outer membrane protein
MARIPFMAALALVGAAAALSGCGLPTTGPRGERIELGADITARSDEPRRVPYCLVPLTPDVVKIAHEHQPRLSRHLDGKKNSGYNVAIGVGDVVSVTIFEAATGGLFFPLDGGMRQGNYVQLPNQIVDEAGMITVPYAGSIKAAGRTVRQVQAAIVENLKGRALEPQAVVTLIDQRAAMISVLGEVGRTLRYPASASPERVLDALARAGGPRGPGHETWVLLERRGQINVAPFEALVHEPANNIVVHPQDTIYLYRDPQTFLAFGATGKQGHLPFEHWKLSLAEAIGKAGGLLDTHAEPRWVFIYRAERRHMVEHLDHGCAELTEGSHIPVVYELDLREPSGFFLASKFPMRNKDVLYVANARTVETSKFYNYIRTVNSTVQDPIQTAITAYSLKNIMNASGTAATTVITTTAPGP